MGKIIRLTESDLVRIVKRVLNEEEMGSSFDIRTSKELKDFYRKMHYDYHRDRQCELEDKDIQFKKTGDYIYKVTNERTSEGCGVFGLIVVFTAMNLQQGWIMNENEDTIASFTVVGNKLQIKES